MLLFPSCKIPCLQNLSGPKIMGFAAEIFSGVVVADLVNRCMSFLFTKCENKQVTATVQEGLQLLRRLLKRGDTIVEEAERRHVANLDMLRQLSALRNAAYRGYYILVSSTPSVRRHS